MMGLSDTLSATAVVIAYFALVLLPVYVFFEVYNLMRKAKKAQIRARVMRAVEGEAETADSLALRIASALRNAAGPIVPAGADQELSGELDLLAIHAMGRPEIVGEFGPSLALLDQLRDLDATARRRLVGVVEAWARAPSRLAQDVIARYLADSSERRRGVDGALLKLRFERFFFHKKSDLEKVITAVLVQHGGRITQKLAS